MKGWIFEDNLLAWCEVVGHLAGYPFDETAWNAVISSIPNTDSERNLWFDYPFRGNCVISVHFAHDPGTEVIFVEWDAPAECAAQIVLATDIAQTYRLTPR